jgi:D-glycero-alpha-D-manno-heptose-7-phosphate kinase
VVYSKIENCQSIDEISHPAVRAVLKFLNINRGLEIHHDGDLPARSGMGSSSSFVVGLLNALYALKGSMPSKHQLAEESIHIEQKVLKEIVGSQDQVSTAHGGFNHITFQTNGEMDIRPVTLPPERMKKLNSHLMLFYTGVKRTASRIAGSYVNGIESRKKQLQKMSKILNDAIRVLSDESDITDFGKLLHEVWQTKRSLSSVVSNANVDEIYDKARKAGAIGGKLTGAGGGGFLLLFVSPDKQKTVRKKLKQLINVPFKFEFSGSQIIFFDPQEDYAKLDRERANLSIEPFQELSSGFKE